MKPAVRYLLIIGKSGQLACALQRLEPGPGLQWRSLGRDELDLADSAAVSRAVAADDVAGVINAGAYTQVDKAEDEEDVARRINGDGPTALALACATAGIPLVHVSTDYVFDGQSSTPYTTADPVAPISAYGRSKALGEQGVAASRARAAVVRTAWVFGPDGSNFLKTMLRLGTTMDVVRVVADQFGRPTDADTLALACLKLMHLLRQGDSRAEGLFHVTGSGPIASWADFAETIFASAAALGRPPVRVERITTAEFPTKARRPAMSALDLSRYESVCGPTENWRKSVDVCVGRLLRV